MVNFYSELKEKFEEVQPLDFYRDIFPLGELDEEGAFTKGKFTGIACEFTDEKREDGSLLIKRYTITDELSTIEYLLQSDNFVILSPISYVGKSRITSNARVMYAFAIEIDGIKVKDGRAVGFYNLIHHMNIGVLPKCNYIVASGNGLHLYYLFEKPLLLYPNVVKSLVAFKRNITYKFWNRYVTNLYKPELIQNESAFQGFRLAGGVSKNGDRTKVFKIFEERCSISYLNSFLSEYINDGSNGIEEVYKSKMSIQEAKEKYPDWYKERVELKKIKGQWICKRDLYDWWYRRIRNEANLGHRYYCLMILSIYAIKCGISYEELEKDSFNLLEPFDEMGDENNRFTKKDVVSALQAYQDKGLATYPLNSIIKLSAISIERNKRNFRSQELHLQGARAIQEINDRFNGTNWREGNGRPKGSGSKQDIVKEWRLQNPEGRKIDCIKATGLTKPTVYKWWNS